MKKYYILAIFILILINVTFSQAKKVERPQCRYNFLQVTAGGGFIQPVSYMYQTYNPSGNIGLEVAYRVNPEVAIFLEGRLNFMRLQDNTKTGPPTRYMDVTLGPRFYFVSKNVKSTFFFETAMGPYMKSADAYIDEFGTSIPSVSDTKIGANTGIGGELSFTDNLYFTVKGKYHTIFGVGGTITYFSGCGGLTYRF